MIVEITVFKKIISHKKRKYIYYRSIYTFLDPTLNHNASFYTEMYRNENGCYWTVEYASRLPEGFFFWNIWPWEPIFEKQAVEYTGNINEICNAKLKTKASAYVFNILHS